MPPKISKATLPPRRSQRTTAGNSTVPTSRAPHPPEVATPVVPVNYKNAIPDEELQQPRSSLHTEGNPFDYNNSGLVRPELSSNYNSSVEPVGKPEISALGNSGSVGPEVVNYGRVEPESTMVEAVSGSDSLKEPPKVVNVGGSSGKRTVVKRVVRVVKKVVRKKVPKKVLKDGGLGIEKEEKIENVANLDVKNENLEAITCVSESMDVEKASSSGVNGIGLEDSKLNGSVVAEVNETETEKFKFNGCVVGKELNNEDLSDSVVETMKVKQEEEIENVVNLDVKNENLEAITSVSESMDVEKVSYCGVNGIETEDSKLNGSVVAEVNAIESEDLKFNSSVLTKESNNADLSDSVVETTEDKQDSSVGGDKVESNNKEELKKVATEEKKPVLRKVRKVVKKRVKVVKGALAHKEGKSMEDAMNLDKKNENFQPIFLNVSDSMVVDEGDLTNVGSKETEDATCNNALQLELENKDSRNNLVDGNAERENKEELNIPINEKIVEDKRLQDQLGNKNTSPPLMLPVSDKSILLKAERVKDHLGNKNMGTPLELPKISPVESERMNNQLKMKNVSLVEDENMAPEGESNSADGVKGAKEPLESNSDMTNDVLVWSGEMEAVERRKRRKTEIFVGGLDKDAKVEDIRKVFEEVGEIVEVRLMMNNKTGKNKGFAFIRYTSADAAAKAITKYNNAEICGKECSVKPVEGNDTLYLGNINRNWKTENIVKLLKEAGIDKIDKVIIIADPRFLESNRGFAFVEFETCKDAQTAFYNLQKKDAFGSHQQIKVEWAQQLVEPDEEEILKVKSVYAEYLPSSWDEEEVRKHFKKFGEIENVSLARTRPSSRRKDFAFVNYTSREAALACIEAFSREQIDNDGSKVQIKVSLAKPMPKGKQTKHPSNPTAKELPKEKLKAAQSIIKPSESRNKRKHAGDSHEGSTVKRSSTNVELVQLLRQQALSGQAQPGLSTGFGALDRQSLSLGSKRPFSTMVNDPLSSDRRGFQQLPSGRSYPVQIPGSTPNGVSMASSSYYHLQGINYPPQSVSRERNYPSQFQTRQQAFYYDNNGVLRRY